MPFTRNEIEQRAAADFAALPKYMRVTYLKGNAHNGDTRECWFDDPGVLVRVDQPSEGELTRWMGDYLDPLWPVTPLESRNGMSGIHGWEMYGTSYKYPTGEKDETKFTPVSRIRAWWEALTA